MEIQKLLRPHIKNIVPYSSARDEYSGTEGIFLDANENPFGSVLSESYNRYPDPYQTAIKEKLAEIKGVQPKQIFLGNGSDEAIDLLIRAFCEPQKDNILIMPPTYGMYEVSANINGVAVNKVNLSTDFQIDTQHVFARITPDTKLVFICSPNNPTGNSLQQEAIIEILDKFEGIVVLDEAYIDFCEETSFVKQLNNYPNLVIIQTFSKAWGLAALRLGMAFASSEIISVLNSIKPPYNINLVTQQLVLESLQKEAFKNEMVTQIVEERVKLKATLSQFSFVEQIYSSDANFLLVRMKNASQIFDYLLNAKIIVRNRSKIELCENCLRITIGTRVENQKLLQVLHQVQLSI